jgi:phosphatidylglycerol---prolipoprotein diacylglyceryl transferase
MIAFYLPGNIPIYTSALLLGLGTAIGMSWTAWQAPLQHRRSYLDAGLWTLLGGLAIGRASFVAVHWDYFQIHPSQAMEIYLGGLFWCGALAGSVISIAIVAGIMHLPLGELSDALLPLLALVAACAWLGCWVDGYAYGAPVMGYGGVLARDEWGGLAQRWPVQLFGALLSMGLLSGLFLFRCKIAIPGRAALLGIIGLSVEICTLSFLRADPSPLWHGLRPDTWTSLGLAWFMLLALLVSIVRGRQLQVE